MYDGLRRHRGRNRGADARARQVPADLHQEAYGTFRRRHERESTIAARGDRQERTRFAAGLLKRAADNRNLRIAIDHLVDHGGRATGPDGLDLGDLGEGEMWDLARALGRAILNGTYRPGRISPRREALGDGIANARSHRRSAARSGGHLESGAQVNMNNSDSPVVSPITQQLLARYREINGSLRTLQAERKTLRDVLLAASDDDVPVEPGPYSYSVETRSRQIPTWTKLAMILDPEILERLQLEMPATEMRFVSVLEALI